MREGHFRSWFPGGVVAAVAVGLSGASATAAISGATIISYKAGGAAANDPAAASAALGTPSTANGLYGPITPFNPPFASDEIITVTPGGNVALAFSSPVAVSGGGLDIGIFANNGIVDEDPETEYGGPPEYATLAGARGLAGNPVLLFSLPPKAVVSVRGGGSDWIQVSSNPITFDVPTNTYLDSSIDLGVASPGTQVADFAKPFDGDLSDFNGLWYRDASQPNDIVRVLNGSAGGTWIDVSGTGLSHVDAIRFDVPADADYRFVLDAVTAVPEPGAVGVIAATATAGLLARRRRKD